MTTKHLTTQHKKQTGYEKTKTDNREYSGIFVIKMNDFGRQKGFENERKKNEIRFPLFGKICFVF